MYTCVSDMPLEISISMQPTYPDFIVIKLMTRYTSHYFNFTFFTMFLYTLKLHKYK